MEEEMTKVDVADSLQNREDNTLFHYKKIDDSDFGNEISLDQFSLNMNTDRSVHIKDQSLSNLS